METWVLGREQADSTGWKAMGREGQRGPSPTLPAWPIAERGKTLVQKKPTMYPEWKSTFDAHIYEGRVIQIVLMRAAEEPMSEVTVGVSVLAERCKKNNGKAEFWVRGAAMGMQHGWAKGAGMAKGTPGSGHQQPGFESWSCESSNP